jgi:hypothetical protein
MSIKASDFLEGLQFESLLQHLAIIQFGFSFVISPSHILRERVDIAACKFVECFNSSILDSITNHSLLYTIKIVIVMLT